MQCYKQRIMVTKEDIAQLMEETKFIKEMVIVLKVAEYFWFQNDKSKGSNGGM